MGAREQLGQTLDTLDKAAGGLQTVSATVTDVTDTGTVHLMMGGAAFYDVACTDAYRNRRAGDIVAVRRGAVPVVLWRLGEDPADTDAAAIAEQAREAAADLIAISAFTWGTAAPGAGWEQVTELWTKKDSAGKGVLYARLASAPDPSPEAPATQAPKTAVISPTDSGTWRRGRPDDYASSPTQGDWTGRGDRRGGWFYGTAIAAACTGKTVASMSVKFTRKRGAGINGKVRMRLYLHDHTSAPSGQLDLDDGPQTLLSLAVGAKGTATLPADWRAALASGSARGLAIYGHGRADYAAFTGGQITIRFSAT
ncbi:hypothetical protein [Streptomyces scabiei]|uniref:hypothetical protein n=1 Tax=Streptomyces scabiei TaxID=1930 RepID=UPI0004E6DA81|nr:hypothetical protein [Streptomyces scabiei]KFG07481.1 hypothetical protein IQ61_19140 [Streptomyces scabiei]MDX3679514.1 hypothetical protein [Streptomyces scabiei]